jgi:hypothetical protein
MARLSLFQNKFGHLTIILVVGEWGLCYSGCEVTCAESFFLKLIEIEICENKNYRS